MSASLVATLIIANLLALKIWSCFGIPVDAGIFIFPLSYIAGDLLAEFFGEKIANFVALIAALFAVLTAALLGFACQLQDYPGADNQGFEIVASMAGQVFFASIFSFLLGQFTNNRIFELIRGKSSSQQNQQDRQAGAFDLSFMAAFAKRAITSSSVAHLVDAVIFELVAFCGRLPVVDFVIQVVSAYFAGLMLELVFFPVTYFLVAKDRRLN